MDSFGDPWGFGIWGGAVGAAPPAPLTLEEKAAELAARHAVADDLGGWTGFTTEVFDTTVNCTTPNAVKAAIATWAADPSKLLDVTCDWDGPLDLTGYFSGVPDSSLTADAGAWGGYQRPAGGVRVRNKDGKTPCFGNTLNVYSFPKLEFNGVGFATMRKGVDRQVATCILLSRTTGWLLPTALVVKNCKAGLTHWRPSELPDEYTSVITAGRGLVLSVHVEGNEFDGVFDRMRGPAKFWRAFKNTSRQSLNDFMGVYSVPSAFGWEPNDYINLWMEDNIGLLGIDEAAFSALHQDFMQTGDQTDDHAGYKVLCRRNVGHLSGALVGGSQGQYNSDMTNPNSEFCVYDNLFAVTAYYGIQIWDRSGTKSQFVESNTVVAAGLRGTDSYQWIRVNPTSGGGANIGDYGYISIKNNIMAYLENSGAFMVDEAGNLYCDPRKNLVSGDGTSYAQRMRPEDVFTGPFDRDGVDFLTYTVVNEDSTDIATAFYSFVDRFEPLLGWGSAGCSDPETWPNAPTRPLPILSDVVMTPDSEGGSLAWSTDRWNGTAYLLIDGNATRTAAQVIADGTTQAVTASGAQTAYEVTGKSESTAYYYHLVHVDAAGSESAVSEDTFTTTSAFTPVLADNNGVTSARSTSYGGPAASKTGHISLWFKNNAGAWPSSTQYLIDGRNSGGNQRMRLQATSGGKLYFYLNGDGPVEVFTRATATSSFAVGTVYHLLMAWDAATSTFQMYVNDVEVTSFSVATGADNPVAQLASLAVLSTTTLSSVGDFSIHNVYIDHTNFLDLSVEANRRNFIDGSGNPVDTSAYGSPFLRTTNDVTNFFVNTGSGGNLTENAGPMTADTW